MKKVLIGCSIVSAIFIVVIVVSGYFVFQRLAEFRPKASELPAELENPSVLIGADFVTRNTFYEDSRLREITDINIGELDPSPGLEIGIAGTRGAVLLDENHVAKAQIMFHGLMSHVDIIDAEGDGTCEFMNRGSWGNKPSLIDHKGNILWTYGGRMPGVDDMDAGDIDGDGQLEYAVGFNGGGGVHLLDEHGKKQWNKSDRNVWHVEIVDTDGDGTVEIVHSNASGLLKVRDKKGDVVSSSQPGSYMSKFSLCRWPSNGATQYALLLGEETLWLVDFKGNTVAKLNAPGCTNLREARGTPVKIKNDQPDYFSVVVSKQIWDRAILYIYNGDSSLVYQEVLPAACASIATMSSDDGQTESLLVGGDGKVWQYRSAVAEEES
jgi:hypothetical protein